MSHTKGSQGTQRINDGAMLFDAAKFLFFSWDAVPLVSGRR